MNTDTGAIYRGQEEILAAMDRGEPIVPISELVVQKLELGERELQRRRRRKAAKQSRKKNR
jgi:hypothetical protein